MAIVLYYYNAGNTTNHWEDCASVTSH